MVNPRLQHTCTFCCSTLITVNNCLACTFGGIILITSLVLVLYDPIAMQQFNDIVNLATIEIAMLVSGFLLLVSACIGRRFTEHKQRRTGFLFLLLVLGGFALQLYAFSHIILSQGNLANVENLLNSNISDSIPSDFVNGSEQRSLKSNWESFSGTFEHYNCTMAQSGSTALSPAMFSPAYEITALASEITPFGRALSTQDDVFDKCQKAERKVECAANSLFGGSLTRWCKAPLEEEEGDGFTKDCSQCVANYVELAKLEDGLSDENKAKLREKFQGQTGALFCRCLAGTFSWAKSQETFLFWMALVYMLMHILVALSVIWILCWGPGQDGGTEMPRLKDGKILVQVVCPHDSGPGQWVLVNSPDGREGEVEVPPHVFPGQIFQVYI